MLNLFVLLPHRYIARIPLVRVNEKRITIVPFDKASKAQDGVVKVTASLFAYGTANLHPSGD